MANPLDLPEGHRRTTAPAPPDTFPKLLRQHADVRGQQPAMREKDLGIWQSWNWKQVADEVQALACGLAAMMRDCANVRDIHSLAFGGGALHNRLLKARLTFYLADFTLLFPQQLPAGDGAIALGQAVIAAARLQA